jgi:radical SAM superfamily enzyme YgiQ (UPF0313 family)
LNILENILGKKTILSRECSSPRQEIRVGLVQIGEGFGRNQYYFPYSIGILQAYAQRHLANISRYRFMLPIYRRVSKVDAVDRLRDADVVFFSSYLWNYKASLVIAEEIKRCDPAVLIVFGGPQIPVEKDKLETMLRKHPFIDIGCYGEGEVPFLEILQNLPDASWERVSSIGYIDGAGKFVMTPAHGRIENLNEIASPYLEGVFDALMAENPDVAWSAMWETNRGCPFSCTFCAWGSADKKRIYHFDLQRLYKEIDWFSQHKIEFVFCCDANFGLFSRDLEIARKIADNKALLGYPQVFSVQNTKDSKDKVFELQKVLHEAELQKGVNLAFQSLNPQTLKSIRRANVQIGIYRDLQQQFSRAGIPTFSDIIIGLPEETYDSLTHGISTLIEQGQHNKIQFINLAVLENTAMADSDYQEKYGLILQEVKMVSHHSGLSEKEDFFETQHLVIGTKTMPKADWLESRIFCWMLSLLHFHKLLQIPFILLNRLYGLSYRKLAEAFMTASPDHPCLSEIYGFLRDKAEAIQKGDAEYVPSERWLNIWWPVEEYLLIRLVATDMLPTFYREAEDLLSGLLSRESLKDWKDVLKESIDLNEQLIKRPFIDENIDLFFHYNTFDVYRDILTGKDASLKKDQFSYRISRNRESWHTWEDWLREVVWYGGKKGAFFYPCLPAGSKE